MMSTPGTDRSNIDCNVIALVTGANKKIGKEISRQLSTEGVLVLMGARDSEGGEKPVADLRADGLPVEFIHIDLTSQQTVDRAASSAAADG